MKELSKQDKDAIREALLEYCGNYPSQNRASESLSGVSAATVSQICNQKYTSISDDMFSRIAAQIGFSMDRWTLTESNAFQRITFAMSDAQAYKNTTWVVGDAGCGKTTAAIEYRRTHRNVFYILCSEDMRKSDFVREIAKQVGAPVDGTNLRDILEYAISMIAFLQNPLIIFDEGDKLTDSVFSYFISIYNRLENKAGHHLPFHRLHQAPRGERPALQQERLQGDKQPYRPQVLRCQCGHGAGCVCHLPGKRADRTG